MRPHLMNTLPKDIIGHLLTFLSYHEWAKVHRTSRLFWHDKHDMLRKAANCIRRLDPASSRQRFLKDPFITFEGKITNLSTTKLHSMLEMVFGGEIPEGILLVNESVISSILQKPITEMTIYVYYGENIPLVLSHVKIPILKIVTLRTGIPSFLFRIYSPNLIVTIRDWSDSMYSSYCPYRKQISFNIDCLDCLTKGWIPLILVSKREYDMYSSLGLSLTNFNALFSASIVPKLSCQHEISKNGETRKCSNIVGRCEHPWVNHKYDGPFALCINEDIAPPDVLIAKNVLEQPSEEAIKFFAFDRDYYTTGEEGRRLLTEKMFGDKPPPEFFDEFLSQYHITKNNYEFWYEEFGNLRQVAKDPRIFVREAMSEYDFMSHTRIEERKWDDEFCIEESEEWSDVDENEDDDP